MEARAFNMFWFKRKSNDKRDDSDFEDRLAKIDKRQDKADVKVEIATIETDKLNELIDRANREDNATLKLFLVMGGDRKLKK